MQKVFNRRSFQAGDVIFREGASGSHAFVVQSGRIRIVKSTSSYEQGTLGFIEPGGIFGEMALLDTSPRMATAIADEPSVLIVIPEELLKEKLNGSHPTVRVIIMVLIRTLRSMSEDIELPSIDLESMINASKTGD